VKTVFESDASLRNYNEKKQKELVHACISSVRLCLVERPAREKVSMRQ